MLEILFKKGSTGKQKIQTLIIYFTILVISFSIYRAFNLKRIFIPNGEFWFGATIIFILISLCLCIRWLYCQVKNRYLYPPQPNTKLKFYGGLVWGGLFRVLCWSGVAALLGFGFVRTLGWIAYELSPANSTLNVKIAEKKHDKYTTKGECTYRVSFYIETREQPTMAECVSEKFFFNYQVGENLKLKGSMSFIGINMISEL